MTLARTTRSDRPTSRRRGPARRSGYAKLTVTLPHELAEAARERVDSGEVASLSALVTNAVGELLAHDNLARLLDEMDARHGPVSPEVQEWANRVVDSIPPSPIT